MTSIDQSQPESPKTYRPWVGVVLSFFITGSAQFLSGKRFAGILWFIGLWLLAFFDDICLASPFFPGNSFAFALSVVILVVWIVMLVQSCKPVPRFSWSRWLLFILLFFVFDAGTFVVKKSFVHPFKIPTGGMSPTLRGNSRQVDGTVTSGDRIFVECYAYWFSKPQRGDIIVFRTKGISADQREIWGVSPDEYYVKRIAGVPGDVLSIQNGHLCNHGQMISEPPALAGLVFPPQPLIGVYNNLTIPKGSYFVVGDNTTNSLDSRYFGTISGTSILGKISKIYWPLGRAGVVQ